MIWAIETPEDMPRFRRSTIQPWSPDRLVEYDSSTKTSGDDERINRRKHRWQHNVFMTRIWRYFYELSRFRIYTITKFRASGIKPEETESEREGGTDDPSIGAEANFFDITSPTVGLFAIVQQSRLVFVNAPGSGAVAPGSGAVLLGWTNSPGRRDLEMYRSQSNDLECLKLRMNSYCRPVSVNPDNPTARIEGCCSHHHHHHCHHHHHRPHPLHLRNLGNLMRRFHPLRKPNPPEVPGVEGSAWLPQFQLRPPFLECCVRKSTANNQFKNRWIWRVWNCEINQFCEVNKTKNTTNSTKLPSYWKLPRRQERARDEITWTTTGYSGKILKASYGRGSTIIFYCNIDIVKYVQ